MVTMDVVIELISDVVRECWFPKLQLLKTS